MPAPASNRTTCLLVYAGLLALLALTALAARLPSGPWSLPVALAIATAKLVLIFLFFMRLRGQAGLIPVFAVAGFFWLTLLGLLVGADYLTRGWPV